MWVGGCERETLYPDACKISFIIQESSSILKSSKDEVSLIVEGFIFPPILRDKTLRFVLPFLTSAVIYVVFELTVMGKWQQPSSSLYPTTNIK